MLSAWRGSSLSGAMVARLMQRERRTGGNAERDTSPLQLSELVHGEFLITPRSSSAGSTRSEIDRRSIGCRGFRPIAESHDGPLPSDFGRGWFARIRRTTSLSISSPKAREICWAMRGQPKRKRSTNPIWKGVADTAEALAACTVHAYPVERRWDKGFPKN